MATCRGIITHFETLIKNEVCVLTFTGDVVFAGCGETSAAVAVDGCHSKLVPTLRSQI